MLFFIIFTFNIFLSAKNWLTNIIFQIEFTIIAKTKQLIL